MRTSPLTRRSEGNGTGRRAHVLLALTLLTILAALAGASPASAASAWWHPTSASRPSAIEPEGTGTLVVTAANLGDAAANGKESPVTITDNVPVGLRPIAAEAVAGEPSKLIGNRGPVSCAVLAQTVTCTYSGTFVNEGKTVAKTLPPFDQIEMLVTVEAQPEAHTGEQNEVTVAGGEAAARSIKRPIHIGRTPSFGVEGWELTPEEEGGALTTQAGKHPFQVTGSFTVNQDETADPVALPKELNGKLPPGLVGNPTPLPQCTLGQFLTITGFIETQCQEQTAVGVAMVTINERSNLGLTTFSVPIYNVEPSVGEAARFGFYLPGTPIFLDPSVRTGSDYGITLGSTNISQTAALLQFKLTFWGVPGDPRHDNSRGISCLENSREEVSQGLCTPLEAHNPPPFLSMPTACSGPLHSTLEGASWKEPERKLFFETAEPMQALDGCNRLSFEAGIKVTPDGTAASSPTGLSVDVHVPQSSVLVANGLAQSNIKDIAVTLPEGVRLNPSAADGLQACSEGLIGYLPGESAPPSDLHFTPGLPQPFLQGANFCPDAAKVATVKITSPLLPPGQPLEGAVYLATPAPNGEAGHNPFNTTVAMYIEAFDPISGTLVKLPGSVTLDQQTGRISSTFENTPQLAFEDAEIHFFGGERAPLATPDRCGTYTTEATFTPWSGNPPIKSSSSFQITSGPHGAPCPGSLPFNPAMNVGSPNINAGGFSPLVTTISRSDGEQNLHNVHLHFAPGMTGILAGIPLCPEAQANAGTCSEASRIGETIVSVGVGGEPYTVTGGKVYLTEKYGGGAFGLSIVNPAVAGPFDLGKVVVRASIQVDPRTAQLTVTTGTIPRILDGFPLEIQHVNVNINRPGFTVNPTSCNPQSITGAIGSWEGASAPLSTPFQVTNCGQLKFTPQLAVTTTGAASRTNGTGVTFKITYPKGALGTQSWFNEAKFEIPRQLPARLTTIQKACLAATFETNRAACPPASIIGHAVVHTQVLPVPLEGPVYFVSYGGAKFPDAVVVLDGYGVHVELHGETFIDGKTGVTSATFRNTPDVPFENLEVTVPAGPFSEFGANLPGGSLNLCGQKLVMPTLFKASDGTVLKQNTQLGVTGCPTKVRVASRKAVKGKITLSVYVPAAGKLTASGKGLSSISKTATGTETLTLILHTKHKGRAKRHVKLIFTPAHGAGQALTATVRA
jgi:hypothetical protein